MGTMVEREVRFNLRRVLLSILLVVVVVTLSLVLFARENLSGMLNALLGANYLFVGLAIGVYLFYIVLLATRWKISISAVGHNAGLRELVPAVWGSVFINNVTPFTYAGGDPFARTYLLGKITRAPYSSCFATILGEFLLDFPIFLSLLAFGLLFSIGRIQTLPALFLIVLWLVVLVVVAPLSPRLLRNKTAAGKIAGIIWRVQRLLRIKTTRAKVSRQVGQFYDGAYLIISRKKRALTLVAFAAILWCFVMLRFFLIFQALGYNPPLAMLLLAVTIPAFVGLVPLLPGGLGTVDAAFFFIYTGFGVSPSLALSAILIERAITYVMATLIGAGALSYLGVRILLSK